MNSNVFELLLSKLLSNSNFATKVSIVEDIANNLEHALLQKINPGVSTLEVIMSTLLGYFLSEDDEELRESLLNALMNASSLANINAVSFNFDPLIADLADFNIEELEYVLWILAFSKKPKYINLIKSYLKHPSNKLKLTAKQAYLEISN